MWEMTHFCWNHIFHSRLQRNNILLWYVGLFWEVMHTKDGWLTHFTTYKVHIHVCHGNHTKLCISIIHSSISLSYIFNMALSKRANSRIKPKMQPSFQGKKYFVRAYISTILLQGVILFHILNKIYKHILSKWGHIYCLKFVKINK